MKFEHTNELINYFYANPVLEYTAYIAGAMAVVQIFLWVCFPERKR